MECAETLAMNCPTFGRTSNTYEGVEKTLKEQSTVLPTN